MNQTEASMNLIPSGDPSTQWVKQVTADPLVKPGETFLMRIPGREPILLVSPFHDRVWNGFLDYLDNK